MEKPCFFPSNVLVLVVRCFEEAISSSCTLYWYKQKPSYLILTVPRAIRSSFQVVMTGTGFLQYNIVLHSRKAFGDKKLNDEL
jgi:hypothetical protein